MSDELVKRLEACSIEWCENMPVGYGPPINPDGPEAAARIRLLEQQLSTAREALEPFAAAWNVHSGKPDVLRHLTLGDLGALAAHHVSGIHFKNAAAAIRSLGEPGAHPPGK